METGEQDIAGARHAFCDTRGAHALFHAFLEEYRPLLERVEEYLDHIGDSIPPYLAEGYIPWRKAVGDLLRGATLVARRISLPRPDDFSEALTLFTFPGAVGFIRDICACCQIELAAEWAERFRRRIQELMEAHLAILREQAQRSR